EAGADQRGDELAGLGGKVDVVRVEPGEVGARGDDADAQQHDAGQHHGAGGGGDGEVRLVPAGQGLGAADRDGRGQQRAAAQQQLVAGEQGAGEEQRDDVVVEPEHHDGAEDVGGGQVALQPEQDGGVEDADAAGQVGGE